jgi:hypothetical protein
MLFERDPATVLDMVIAGRRIQEFIAGSPGGDIFTILG